MDQYIHKSLRNMQATRYLENMLTFTNLLCNSQGTKATIGKIVNDIKGSLPYFLLKIAKFYNLIKTVTKIRYLKSIC